MLTTLARALVALARLWRRRPEAPPPKPYRKPRIWTQGPGCGLWMSNTLLVYDERQSLWFVERGGSTGWLFTLPLDPVSGPVPRQGRN